MSMMQHKKLPRVRVAYLAGATIVSALVTAMALRHNYQTMTELRSAVFLADEQNGDVEAALQNLRSFVGNHMNTELNGGENTIYPPIQLKYRYDRLVAAQKASADNGQVYSDAQAYCEQQNSQDFSGRNRVPCIEDYVAKNGASTTQAAIPEALYKYDFVSPLWSPDVAGIGIVVTILFGLATIGLSVRRYFSRKK